MTQSPLARSESRAFALMIAGASALTMACAPSQCHRSEPAPSVGATWVSGMRAMRAVDGRNLPELRPSQKLVVNFWASWCGPCIQETPSLLKLAAEKPDAFVLISVSEDDSLKDLLAFSRLYPAFSSANVRLFLDRGRSLANASGVQAFPETFIFDDSYKLERRIAGSVDWGSDQVRSLLSSNVKTDPNRGNP